MGETPVTQNNKIDQSAEVRAVSYTHLDVYKRQSQQTRLRERKVDCIIGAGGKSVESKHKVTIL